MTVYGNFEAIKQVFKTTHGSVWSARTAGTSEAPDCCIKLFQLDQDMLDNRDTSFAQHLLVAAALQQAMANKSEYWAPIYGLGSQGTNAFYVTRLYPRSAQSIIEYKTDLSSAELKTLMMAVIDGLMDLDTAFHRSHGNLKPANVLIADRSKIRQGVVVLTDPDAAGEDRPSLTRTPDSKALGELLYALVTHNPHVTARYPLPKSGKWKQLGSTGRQWFNICGTLLSGITRRGTPNLEQIRLMIDSVHPTPRRIPRSILVAVAIAALGAGAYVKRDMVTGWYHQTSSQLTAIIHPVRKPLDRHLPTTSPVAPLLALHPRPAPGPVLAEAHPSLSVDPPLTAVLPEPVKSTIAAPPETNPSITHPQPTRPDVVENIKPQAIAPAIIPNVPPNIPPTTLPAIASAIPPQAPPRVSSTTLPVVPPVAPVVNPPVAIEPKPPVVTHEDEALKSVATTPVPEFHSTAGRAEYLTRRDQFITTHTGLGNAITFSDWTRVLARLEGLDADYPQVDANSSTGWPAGLVGIITARRDAALLQAIDGAFDHHRVDSAPYRRSLQEIQAVSGSVSAARDALSRGDVNAARKAIDDYNITLKSFPPEDADVSDLFGPIHKEFESLEKIGASTDRSALLNIADNPGASLGVRLAAWYRVDTASTDPWPTDLATLMSDSARADRFDTLLKEAGSTDLTRTVTSTENGRRDTFFSRMTTQAAVLNLLKQMHDPQYAALLANAPLWFRYDVALYSIHNTPPAQITDAQQKAYSDLAGQVNTPGVSLMHDVLKNGQSAPVPPLAQCGPGSVKGWTLRGGGTRDHCTYISTSRGDSLEFIRVHLPNDPDGIDCFLCTTETPVALLQHLLSGDTSAMATAQALNTSPVAPSGGMRLWNFNDKTGNVDLDNDDYRKAFIVSPSEQLPAQFVTPQLAFYLARRVGCRLPTSREWGAAFTQAKNSTDLNMKGFATMGWKLRDRQFARLLTNPNREPGYWPDDNIFLPTASDRQIVPRGSNATIWTMTDLTALGGETTSEVSSGAPWPLSTLQASGNFGFRTVGDNENYAGVFHDLIGNVAEFVMDTPVILEEKVNVAPPIPTSQATRRITDWFTPKHLQALSVIGGSALSPTNEDPTKPYPLPGGNRPTMFADVGFRLAFTDPNSLVNAERAVIAQSSYLTAPAK
jgi:hypothetical protein